MHIKEEKKGSIVFTKHPFNFLLKKDNQETLLYLLIYGDL